MPDPLTPTDSPTDPTPLAAITRWHEMAETVRRAAHEIAQATDDLRFFDRADVWQGARATSFREGLAQHQRALVGETVGIVAQLEEVARRIDARAGHLQAQPAPIPAH